MRNARALQRIAIILAVLFVLSLLPVMAVAFYNHPRADDYTYGAVLRKVIDAGQGLPEAVDTTQLLPPMSGVPMRAGRGRSARWCCSRFSQACFPTMPIG